MYERRRGFYDLVSASDVWEHDHSISGVFNVRVSFDISWDVLFEKEGFDDLDASRC